MKKKTLLITAIVLLTNIVFSAQLYAFYFFSSDMHCEVADNSNCCSCTKGTIRCNFPTPEASDETITCGESGECYGDEGVPAIVYYCVDTGQGGQEGCWAADPCTGGGGGN